MLSDYIHAVFGTLATIAISAFLQDAPQNELNNCRPERFDRLVRVDSTPELLRALEDLQPGDFVDIQPGTYRGRFEINGVHGTESKRAYICARSKVHLRPASNRYQYGLHVQNSSYLRISNLNIANFDKGVVLDQSENVVLQKLRILKIGQEGVHFRDNSTNNVLRDSYISHTGLDGTNSSGVNFGEGAYVGSSGGLNEKGRHDRSDNNEIIYNRFSHTGAEAVDIKEGTSGTRVKFNQFNGVGMPIDNRFADSLIDIKGNNCEISDNKIRLGYLNGERIQPNAIEVHENRKTPQIRSGRNNRFKRNRVVGNRDTDTQRGYIVKIAVRGQRGNVVECNNVSNLASMSTSNRGGNCD